MAERKFYLVPEYPLTVLKLFTQKRLHFVVIGGAAIALHGIPRATLDIDLVVPAHSEIVSKLFAITKQAGLFSRQQGAFRLKNKSNLLIGQWITFQDSTGKELLDIFFEETKIFNRLRRRAVKIKGRQFAFYIASLDDLEAMKKELGRPIDLADIALIQEKREFEKRRG